MLLAVHHIDPLYFGGSIVIILFSLGVHEAAHAWMAYKLGDDTAYRLGRMTINPLVHLDLFLSVLLPALLLYFGGVLFGAAKPVPINVMRLRHPMRDFMFASLAGPASNVLLALAFTGFFWIVVDSGLVAGESTSWLWLEVGVRVNLLLAFFNLLPIPPLDGSRVVVYFLPEPARGAWLRFGNYGFVVLVLLFFTGAIDFLFVNLFKPFYDFYYWHLIPLG